MTDTITRAIITDAIVNGVAAWKRNDAAAMDQAIDTAVEAIRDAVATLAQKDTQNG